MIYIQLYLDPIGAAKGGAEYIAAALLMPKIHCCESLKSLEEGYIPLSVWPLTWFGEETHANQMW